MDRITGISDVSARASRTRRSRRRPTHPHSSPSTARESSSSSSLSADPRARRRRERFQLSRRRERGGLDLLLRPRRGDAGVSRLPPQGNLRWRHESVEALRERQFLRGFAEFRRRRRRRLRALGFPWILGRLRRGRGRGLRLRDAARGPSSAPGPFRRSSGAWVRLSIAPKTRCSSASPLYPRRTCERILRLSRLARRQRHGERRRRRVRTRGRRCAPP